MSNQTASYRKRRTLLIVLCTVLAVTLSVLLAGTVYLESLMNRIGRVEETTYPSLSREEIDAIENPQEPESTLPPVAPEDVTLDSSDEVIIGGEELINILLIGQDRREGESRARSDAMILCTVNKASGSITLTSFMRDMYVQIPGYQDNRINAAYQLGGYALLNETLERNFGVEIDGNIEVDFQQFQEIIDILGGVDISLTAEEAEHLNGTYTSAWALTAGVNHLNGEQALAYSRIRYIGDGDYGRTDRQRTVLNALMDAYRNTNLTTMLSLVDDILPLVTTDMSNRQIIRYAMELFPVLAGSEMATQRIPADGTFYDANIRGMSVLVPDLEGNRQFLKDTLLN